MKSCVYSIFDNIASVFNKPFIEFNNDSAVRAFRNALNDNINKNDFVLYHLGTFDDSNGTIVPNNPSKVISGFDLLPVQKEVK